MLLPLQGVNTMAIVTQGVASLALGYVLIALSGRIIGGTSAIQASLIAFGLHDNTAHPRPMRLLDFACPCLNPKL